VNAVISYRPSDVAGSRSGAFLLIADIR
jgi:hypothetical protein